MTCSCSEHVAPAIHRTSLYDRFSLLGIYTSHIIAATGPLTIVLLCTLWPNITTPSYYTISTGTRWPCKKTLISPLRVSVNAKPAPSSHFHSNDPSHQGTWAFHMLQCGHKRIMYDPLNLSLHWDPTIAIKVHYCPHLQGFLLRGGKRGDPPMFN